MSAEKLSLQNRPKDYPSEKEWQEWKKSYRRQLEKEKERYLRWLADSANPESNFHSDQKAINYLKSEIQRINKHLEALDYPLDEVKEVEYGPDLKMRFVYERHDLDHNPEVVRGGLTGYFVECVRTDFNSTNKEYEEIEFREDILGDHYRNIIAASTFNNVPLYVVDAVGHKAAAMFKREIVLIKISDVIAALILSYLLKSALEKENSKQNEKHTISRRDFLKKSFKYGIAGITTGIVSLSIYEKILLPIKNDKQLQLNQFEKIRTKIIEKFGLNKLSSTLRNALCAQKVMTVHRQSKQPDYYGFQCGAAHFGVEAMLTLDNETRLKIIKKIYSSINEKKRPTPEELAVITKFTFDKEKQVWKEQNYLDKSIMKYL